MNTQEFKDWLLSQDDATKLKFAINWGIPHSIFNIACKFHNSDKLQGIDWFDIKNSKGEMIVWERDMLAVKN